MEGWPLSSTGTHRELSLGLSPKLSNSSVDSMDYHDVPPLEPYASAATPAASAAAERSCTMEPRHDMEAPPVAALLDESGHATNNSMSPIRSLDASPAVRFSTRLSSKQFFDVDEGDCAWAPGSALRWGAQGMAGTASPSPSPSPDADGRRGRTIVPAGNYENHRRSEVDIIKHQQLVAKAGIFWRRRADAMTQPPATNSVVSIGTNTEAFAHVHTKLTGSLEDDTLHAHTPLDKKIPFAINDSPSASCGTPSLPVTPTRLLDRDTMFFAAEEGSVLDSAPPVLHHEDVKQVMTELANRDLRLQLRQALDEVASHQRQLEEARCHADASGGDKPSVDAAAAANGVSTAPLQLIIQRLYDVANSASGAVEIPPECEPSAAVDHLLQLIQESVDTQAIAVAELRGELNAAQENGAEHLGLIDGLRQQVHELTTAKEELAQELSEYQACQIKGRDPCGPSSDAAAQTTAMDVFACYEKELSELKDQWQAEAEEAFRKELHDAKSSADAALRAQHDVFTERLRVSQAQMQAARAAMDDEREQTKAKVEELTHSLNVARDALQAKELSLRVALRESVLWTRTTTTTTTTPQVSAATTTATAVDQTDVSNVQPLLTRLLSDSGNPRSGGSQLKASVESGISSQGTTLQTASPAASSEPDSRQPSSSPMQSPETEVSRGRRNDVADDADSDLPSPIIVVERFDGDGDGGEGGPHSHSTAERLRPSRPAPALLDKTPSPQPSPHHQDVRPSTKRVKFVGVSVSPDVKEAADDDDDHARTPTPPSRLEASWGVPSTPSSTAGYSPITPATGAGTGSPFARAADALDRSSLSSLTRTNNNMGSFLSSPDSVLGSGSNSAVVQRRLTELQSRGGAEQSSAAKLSRQGSLQKLRQTWMLHEEIILGDSSSSYESLLTDSRKVAIDEGL